MIGAARIMNIKFAAVISAVASLIPLLDFQGGPPASKSAKTESAPASKPASDEPREEEFLAIVGGDVETVTMGRLRGATVLMKGTKIWKVGRNIDIPAKAKRIDAHGMFVYPGLVATRASGIGVPAFGASGRITDRFDPFAVEVAAMLAGGTTTVVQSDIIMKMQTHSIENLLLREGGIVRINLGTGTSLYDARERFERARNYLFEYREFEARKAANDATAKEPKRDGVDDVSLKLLKHEASARFEVDRAADMLQILNFLDEFRFDCIFSGATEAWTIAGDLSRRNVKVIFAPRRREVADERTARATGSSAEAAAVLARAGVEFALTPPTQGFDAGEIITWDGIGGRELQTYALEGAWCIRGGLDEQRALEALTISAARILGVDHRIGSIEPGKDGDVIITDGPLFDFRTFTQVAVVNGSIQYEKSKHSLFAHIRPKSVPVDDGAPAIREKPASTPVESEPKK
ncbi:MAG: amidohydrolase family protein [Planctomycetes bacterium]|nr:amidohydrolase family protein [Planctomycetota bacterium]